jgi:hypothetical protein
VIENCGIPREFREKEKLAESGFGELSSTESPNRLFEKRRRFGVRQDQQKQGAFTGFRILQPAAIGVPVRWRGGKPTGVEGLEWRL